jgi:hypothetical protein
MKMNKRLSIEEIENILGFNQIIPIPLSLSDEADMKENESDFRKWYENELIKLYEED